MEISLYMKNELTDVIQPALLLQKLKMESLPSVVFDPPPAAAAVGVLRESDQPGGKEGGPWCRRRVGDGRFGGGKVVAINAPPPARHALPLPLAEGSFWVHKGDVPYCSRGSTIVSVANGEVSLQVTSGYVFSCVLFLWQEYVHFLVFAPTCTATAFLLDAPPALTSIAIQTDAAQVFNHCGVQAANTLYLHPLPK